MKKGDVICGECGAGFRRIELNSMAGAVGECRCPICSVVVESLDGRALVAYRLTVQPSIKALLE